MATPTSNRAADQVDRWITRAQERLDDRSEQHRRQRRQKRDAAFTRARDAIQRANPRHVLGGAVVFGVIIVALGIGVVASGSQAPERLGATEAPPEDMASINARESYQGLAPPPEGYTNPQDVTIDGSDIGASDGAGTGSDAGNTTTTRGSAGATDNLSQPDVDIDTDTEDVPEISPEAAALLVPGVPRTLRADEAFDVIGNERAKAGVGALSMNNSLNQSAQNHANWLANTGNYCHSTQCNHRSQPDPGFSNWGENIGWQRNGDVDRLFYDGGNSPGFMNSPSHRDNTLDPQWTQVGIGVAKTKSDPQRGKPAYIFVIQFAKI